jgi:hypothetical protein
MSKTEKEIQTETVGRSEAGQIIQWTRKKENK